MVSDGHPAARILVVEDTPTQAELARALLGSLGYQARIAPSAGWALVAAREWQPDAILVDIELPDYNGFELMQQLHGEGIDAAVIVVTANASISAAVQAMRAGAVDFIVKPYAKARLAVTLANVLEKRALVAVREQAETRADRDKFFGFIGSSAPMRAAYRTIESVAGSKASVFITGESGTGKELAADAVHRASPRASHHFVALNCGAIPRDLLESEVFGHVRGAFTGAANDREGAAKLADGGSVCEEERRQAAAGPGQPRRLDGGGRRAIASAAAAGLGDNGKERVVASGAGHAGGEDAGHARGDDQFAQQSQRLDP